MSLLFNPQKNKFNEIFSVYKAYVENDERCTWVDRLEFMYGMSIDTIEDYLKLSVDVEYGDIVIVSIIDEICNIVERYKDKTANVIIDERLANKFSCFNPVYDDNIHEILYEEDGYIKVFQFYTIKDQGYLSFGSPVIGDYKYIKDRERFYEYIKSLPGFDLEYLPEDGLPTFADEYIDYVFYDKNK